MEAIITMDRTDVVARLAALEALDINLGGMDFLLTTDKTRAELEAVLLVAELLEILHRLCGAPHSRCRFGAAKSRRSRP